MFASSTAAGMCMAVPDVCLVPAPPLPPIPTPFPNMGQCAMAVSTSMKVMIENRPTIVLNSIIPISSGDEAGVNGGVMSGMFIGQVSFKLGSFKVMAEGKPVGMLGSMTAHNGPSANAIGAQIVPSQAKVILKG